MSRPSRATIRATLSTRVDRAPAPGSGRLSVIVPAYREADTIGAAVERIRSELSSVAADGLQVVIVDDGSGDGTADAARAAGADEVIAQPVNRGKGAAVRAGVAAATGRTVVFTDADLSYAPAQIERLLEAVESGWDVAVGNRHHEGSTTIVPTGALRQIGGRVINVATKTVLVGHHLDTQCGLKAFRSDAAQVLFGHGRIDGFAFDVEILSLVERYGLSLTEVPVEVEYSDRSTVRVGRDAVLFLSDLVRIRSIGARGGYDLEPGALAQRSGGHRGSAD